MWVGTSWAACISLHVVHILILFIHLPQVVMTVLNIHVELPPRMTAGMTCKPLSWTASMWWGAPIFRESTWWPHQASSRSDWTSPWTQWEGPNGARGRYLKWRVPENEFSWTGDVRKTLRPETFRICYIVRFDVIWCSRNANYIFSPKVPRLTVHDSSRRGSISYRNWECYVYLYLSKSVSRKFHGVGSFEKITFHFYTLKLF